MKDYATFKRDGITCKEEIIWYRQLSYNPVEIIFYTPTGLYRYKQEPYPSDEVNVKGVNGVIKAVMNHFYKFDGEENECEFYYGEITKIVRAKWKMIPNLESISFSYPTIS